MGGVSFPGKKHYEGVRFNVISITRGWMGVKFPGKRCYVTLEWHFRTIKIVYIKNVIEVRGAIQVLRNGVGGV